MQYPVKARVVHVGLVSEGVGVSWSWREELVVSLVVEGTEGVGTRLRGCRIRSGCSFVLSGLISTGVGVTFCLRLVEPMEPRSVAAGAVDFVALVDYQLRVFTR